MDQSLSYSQALSFSLGMRVLIALNFFCLPLSSTAKTICLSLTILAILANPSIRSLLLTSLWDKAWVKAAVALFLLALVATLWSPATGDEKALMIEKYAKFLYLPLFALSLSQDKTRRLALVAFLVAMLLTSSIAILKYQGFLSAWAVDPEHVFHNHIITGFMLAFAAFLSLFELIRQKARLKQGYYLLLFLIFSYHLFFVNGGRTAYILYFVMLAILILDKLPWHKAALAFSVLLAFACFCYWQSPGMHERVHLIVNDLQHYQQDDKNTPVGFRLQFHTYAKSLLLRQPLLGNGTASFTSLFAKEKPVQAWPGRLPEPHSQYWLVAAEFGLVGLACLAFFCLALLKACLALNEYRALGLAMLIALAIGNLADSVLYYSGSGHFFIFFMALALGEQIEAEKKRRR